MPLSKPCSKSVPSICSIPFLWTQQRTSSSSAAPQPSCCFWPGERQGGSPVGPRSPCSWTSWTHGSSQAQWQTWGGAGCNRASARTVLSTSQRVSSLLTCCQPPAWVYLRPALPACPYHQSPDIPAGGWDTRQGKKRKKTKETKQVKGGPCAPEAPGPPCSPRLLSPLSPSIFTPFFPPSFFSSSLPPSIPCLPGPVILTI